ncbi:MAG: hypothetical protein P0Y56_14255 [Candidatus Andeanibacterium colombiense]|uniref:Uncharacterized protein n=1 Tax=Candidatus Andeanibacterium colombiense TaxID=3121345 RepID=A0AAJ6BM93_9SPHN|nr:MAG: hypothetical protein P0Y56_14255 [Sphingomonadaceae bacterium]
MYQVSSASNRIVAGVAAFGLTLFVIAASFAPQGAFVASFVA